MRQHIHRPRITEAGEMDRPSNTRALKAKRGRTRHSKTNGKSAEPHASIPLDTPGKQPPPLLSIVLCIRASKTFRASGRAFFPALFADQVTETGLAAEIVIVDSSEKAETARAISEAVGSFGGTYVRDEPASRKYSLARARNVGVAAARGQYILLADIDLVPPAGFISNLTTFLEKGRLAHAENHFAIIPVLYLKDDVCPDVTSRVHTGSLADWLHGENARHVASFQMVNSTILMHRSFYRLLGGQHEGFRGWGMEDWHFLWKLMCFPQPVPGLPTQTRFHRNPPEVRNDLKSWRDAAWFVGDEALRHGLYLFHMPHEMRTDGWRGTSANNSRRFDRLVEDRMVFEAAPSLKTGQSYRVCSEDPAAANALLFPPDAQVTAGRPEEIDGLALRLQTGTESRLVIGSSQPDTRFYSQFESLARKGGPFDFLYPSGVPQALFYFSCEDGIIRRPRSVDWPPPLDPAQTYDLDTTALNAYHFRNRDWRRGKFLVLFVLSEDKAGNDSGVETMGGTFGLSSAGFRSLVNALVPLLDGTMAAMVWDLGNGGEKRSFPVEGAYDVSDQQLDFLINAADVVVAQSPRFVLNAAILGKPVITTATLLADILPCVPVARSLFDVHTFISSMRASPAGASGADIDKALARACIYAADNRGAPAAADLMRRQDAARILYEQVTTPDHTARFKFTTQPEETALLAWLWPHLDQDIAARHHLAISHDPWLNRTVSSGHKSAVAKPAAPPPGGSQVTAGVKAKPATQRAGPILDPALAANDSERSRMYRTGRTSGAFSRKIAKLKRDPHQFFADTRNPALRGLKLLFPAR